MGHIANLCWQNIVKHYPNVRLGDSVVMPNHIHGILYFLNDDPAFKTILGNVISGYKAGVTSQIRKMTHTKQIVWQSRYYDHILRDDIDELRIRTYIQNNVAKWADDSLYGDS